MTVKKVWALYFSGTGTTKKTVDRIAHRLAEALGTDCEVYDYTLPAARRQELTIPSGDVAVVGCPTYAGRVPNLLMPYLRIWCTARVLWRCLWCCSATAITMTH